jgi:hypothetical protein
MRAFVLFLVPIVSAVHALAQIDLPKDLDVGVYAAKVQTGEIFPLRSLTGRAAAALSTSSRTVSSRGI